MAKTVSRDQGRPGQDRQAAFLAVPPGTRRSASWSWPCSSAHLLPFERARHARGRDGHDRHGRGRYGRAEYGRASGVFAVASAQPSSRGRLPSSRSPSRSLLPSCLTVIVPPVTETETSSTPACAEPPYRSWPRRLRNPCRQLGIVSVPLPPSSDFLVLQQHSPTSSSD